MTTNSNQNWETFQALVDAEDYFTFFGLPYDPQVVNVNRLHILQKFAQNLAALEETVADPTEAERLNFACQALQEAYQTFIESSPLDLKLFKVFNQRPQGVVLLSEVTSS